MLNHDRLQLPLPFPYEPRYDPRDFVPATANRAALRWLETEWPEQRLAVFGAGGVGKSHLLHLWADQTGAVVLAGQTLVDLDGLPQHGCLAVDDADTIGDEALLFHLLNTARDRRLRLLLSGRTAPSRWPVALADLSSRLRALTAVEIHQPDDDLLAALLMRLLADRQLSVAQSVQEWLLLRLPRSPSVLREVVARLDRASLTWHAPITRPLAARVLTEGGFTRNEPDEVSMSKPYPSSEGIGLL